MRTPDITWHTIRDNFAEMTGLLALVSASLGKIGYDIMLMMQTETGEVLEPFVPGRGASSTMPQKRNPIASEMMLAAAKIVREQHSAMLDAVVQDHERATGQWHVEWQVIPTAFIVTSGGLQSCPGGTRRPRSPTRRDARGARCDGRSDRRRSGDDGARAASSVARSLTMSSTMPAAAQRSSRRRSFPDALLAEPQVAAVLSRDELEQLVEPGNYVGAAPEMTRRLLARREA